MSRRRLHGAMNLDRALLRAVLQQERDETDPTALDASEVKNTRETPPPCKDRSRLTEPCAERASIAPAK